ncbi:MAG: hypothetical protein KDH89_18045, partial [Anaerolineae bacterium]|nr:hypothetical protein [Anaerolineae bacterium]
WNQIGTWTSDNDHNHLGQTWTGVNNSLVISGTFDAAPYTPGQPKGAPLVLANTLPTQPTSYGYGLRILDGAIGTVVDHAGTGMWVESAEDRGYYVARVGQPPVSQGSLDPAAFEVAGTEGSGLFVGYSGSHGVWINIAGGHGLSVENAMFDGLHVGNANNGLNVGGTNLAGYFHGPIQVTSGGCTGCLLATFGVNAGDKTLQPGDMVSLVGLRESGVDSVPVIMEVTTATDDSAVVGVVQGWAELVTEDEPRPSEIGKRLVPREGAAEPGQYVTIAYSGLTQVRATGPIAQGSKLAVGADGTARALHTVTVDGVELAENASVIGTALEGLDAMQESDLIWVLLSVQ